MTESLFNCKKPFLLFIKLAIKQFKWMFSLLSNTPLSTTMCNGWAVLNRSIVTGALSYRIGATASVGDEAAARREQERLDEEVARSLQAEEDERIARQQAGAGNQRPTRAATAAGGNDGGKCSLQWLGVNGDHFWCEYSVYSLPSSFMWHSHILLH